ncbi:MAG: tetratricopeptide repeat protein [Thermoguttaceae bacterium]|jgi:tetratricopeptide (TPR) repeat protein|nr:tetratricopeptide repeat protein [Thermoguttaceae bacterium]
MLRSYKKLAALAVSASLLVSTAWAQNEPNATKENASGQAASSSEPQDPDAQVNPKTLAAIDLYAQGDVEGAYNLFKQVYDENPDSDPPGVLLAILHSHAGKFLEMRRALEESAEDYPADPEAYLQLAGIDAREGRFLEARLLIERAEALIDAYKEYRPETTTRHEYLKEEALTMRANLAERRERYEEARTIVQKILDANPENAQAFWNLGYLSMKLKDYDAAEKAYDAAAKLNSELWPGWLQVATSLDKEDLVDEGKARITKLEEMIANAPKSQRAQVARLYLRWNMIEEAGKIIAQFVEDNDEKDLDRWLLSGWVALYASQFAAAEENFRNATLVAPNNFEASNGLALAMLDQNNKGKLGTALQIAARNYRAYPDNLEAAVTYAWTLFLSGYEKEADEIFGPILSSGQMTATVAYYLAEIANRREDKSLANTLLKLALSQKSNFPKRIAALELKALLEEESENANIPNPLDDFEDDPFPEEEEDMTEETEQNL